MAIQRGTLVEARTAHGTLIKMRALGAPEPGPTFEILWVATESEWSEAVQGGLEPEGLPWPTDAVWEIRAA